MAVVWITPAETNNPAHPSTPFAIEAASWILYKLTAEKYPGITQRSEWYGIASGSCGMCLDPLVGGSEYYNEYLTLHHHIWYTNPSERKIRLRGYPVRSIESISYGGETLTPDKFYLENKKYLSRRDGQCWNMSTGLDVQYTAGINPPEAGKQAAIRLANEIILANTDPANCALPERVTSISRQGIDYTLLDAQDFLENGRTGIYEVDIFIKAANPTNAKKKPRVFSVDLPSGMTRM